MFKLTSKRKRFILTTFLSVLVTFLLAPVYSDNHMFGSWQDSRFNNKIARVDLFNAGNADNRIEILLPPPPPLKRTLPGLVSISERPMQHVGGADSP